MIKDLPETGRRGFLIGGTSLLAAAALPRLALAQAGAALRVGMSAYPANFNPFAYLGTAAETIKIQSYRGLVSFDAEAKVVPDVAESWSQPDATTYVFKLREGATFHNGDPVTANEVKATFERIAAPNSGAFRQGFFAGLAGIEATDPLTVTLKLKKPNAIFLATLASYCSPIISARSLTETPDTPAGCGPFRITGQERGAWIEMEAFEGYYKPGLPASRALRFTVYADENARVAALQSGEVDLIEYVPAMMMPMIESDANLVLDATEGPASVVLFNCTEGPFVDPRVRQAVAYAIDRDAVCMAAFAGQAVPAGPIPISRKSPLYPEKFHDHFARDLDKAKALLTEAGFPNGFQTTLLATNQYSVHRDPAMVVQQNLAEIGIQAQLELPDWATRVQLGNAGQYHIAISATAMDINDPSAVGTMIQGGQAPSFSRPFGYQNAEVDRLLAAAQEELDETRRKQLFEDLAVAFVEDPGLISFVWRNQAYAWRAGATGFSNLPGYATYNSGIMIENMAISGA